MNKQVFIINGSGGCGKDTFVSFVSDISYTINFSSVDKVKEVARIIGWDGGKTEKDRKFLSDLKLLCTNYNDMPLNSMKDKYEEFLDSHAKFLFLHIREPEEIEKAKRIFKAKTILIKRDSVEHITSNMADANVFNYNYDILIENDKDVEEFRDKAFNLVNDFSKNQLKNKY